LEVTATWAIDREKLRESHLFLFGFRVTTQSKDHAIAAIAMIASQSKFGA
jgi:hypothetical protein